MGKGKKKNIGGGEGGGSSASVGRKPRNQRFFDLSVSTSNANSGTQQYGAGQTIRSRHAPPRRGRNLGDTGHVDHGTSVFKAELGWQCEPILDLNASTGLDVTSVAINPGLPAFAWASKVIGGYEKYSFSQLRFKFVSSLSGYATDGQQGSVVLAFDYDALEGPPTTLDQALTYNPSVLTMPAQSVTLDVDHKLCTPDRGKYVRTGPVAGDLKTYDSGVLRVCTEGMVGTGPIGRIMVEYFVVGIKPRVSPPALSYYADGTTLRWDAVNPGLTGTIGSDPSYPWVLSGGANTWPNLGSLPINIEAAGVLHFPQGRYLLHYQLVYGGTSTGSTLSCYILNPATGGYDFFYVGSNSYASASTASLQGSAPLVISQSGGTSVYFTHAWNGVAGASGSCALCIQHLAMGVSSE